jgi:hypothetical protein
MTDSSSSAREHVTMYVQLLVGMVVVLAAFVVFLAVWGGALFLLGDLLGTFVAVAFLVGEVVFSGYVSERWDAWRAGAAARRETRSMREWVARWEQEPQLAEFVRARDLDTSFFWA